jgi:hypothetical protein
VLAKHIHEAFESHVRQRECRRSSQTVAPACSDATSQSALEEVAQAQRHARGDAEQETMALVSTVSSQGRIVEMRTETEPGRDQYDDAEVLVCAA